LTYIQNGKISSIISFLDNKSKNPFVIEGLIRAIAMLKLIPSREDIEQIIAYGNMEDVAENHRTWIASAAADWTSNSVVCFLNKCVTSDNQQTRRAAKCSLRKEYLEWSIL
jgi:hypothetical protein